RDFDQIAPRVRDERDTPVNLRYHPRFPHHAYGTPTQLGNRLVDAIHVQTEMVIARFIQAVYYAGITNRGKQSMTTDNLKIKSVIRRGKQICQLPLSRNPF